MQRTLSKTNLTFSPILNNSIAPIKEFHLAKIIERILKLSTVSLVSWLAGFFCIFHSTLNALAEITHFADRKFYEAWWNSGSVGTYWRLWNLPVHSYFKRHIYVPLKRRGWSNRSASIMVFFISAVIHEILLGIPTHAVSSRLYAVLIIVNRSRIPGNAWANSSRIPNRAAGKDERFRNNDWKLYILDNFLFSRSTLWGIILFLSVSSSRQNVTDRKMAYNVW